MKKPYVYLNDGKYEKAEAPGVDQPWEPRPQEIPQPVQELPDVPTDDGTYTLTCTVTGGEATLAWVSSE